MAGPPASYHEITERPGHGATREQIARLYERYHFARLLSEGKVVLEVACGSGLGLGYLATAARASRGRSNVSVHLLDAQRMALPSASADIILLFEAIYYLQNVDAFLQEAVRVLRPGGKLVIATVNREWPDFHPSPKSVRYFTAGELRDLLERSFSKVSIYASFPARSDSFLQAGLSLVKRAAVKLHLMPKTLKRLFYGSLQPLPEELTEGMAPYRPPVEVSGRSPCPEYKILYAVGELGA